MIAAEQDPNSTLTLEASPNGQVQRTVLPGGVRVITETMLGVRSASIGMWMRVGSRDELDHQAGCSHYLEHLLFKGTKNRDTHQIAMEIDAMGGESNAFTDKENTCFYSRVRDANIPHALDLLLDVVTNSLVAPAEVEEERGVILEEIAMRDDDPGDAVSELFAATILGTSTQRTAPLGRPIIGTNESITGMAAQTIADYYRTHYTPDRLAIAVAGNVEHDQVVAWARQGLQRVGWLEGGRTPGAPRLPNPGVTGEQVVASPGQFRLSARQIEQANVMMGVPGVHRNDERRFALAVADAMLGGGMSSRLFRSIRTTRALAYSVYSYNWQYSDAGIFGCYAGCLPRKTEQVIELMHQELDTVVAQGFTDEEVTRAKGQVQDEIVLGLEDPSSRMMRLGRSEWLSGQWVGIDERLARVANLTAEQVNQTAAQLLRQPRTLAVLGPFPEDSTFAATANPTAAVAS